MLSISTEAVNLQLLIDFKSLSYIFCLPVSQISNNRYSATHRKDSGLLIFLGILGGKHMAYIWSIRVFVEV